MGDDNTDTSGPAVDNDAPRKVKKEFDHLFWSMGDGILSSVDRRPAIGGSNELVDWWNTICQEYGGKHAKVEIHISMHDKDV